MLESISIILFIPWHVLQKYTKKVQENSIGMDTIEDPLAWIQKTNFPSWYPVLSDYISHIPLFCFCQNIQPPIINLKIKYLIPKYPISRKSLIGSQNDDN